MRDSRDSSTGGVRLRYDLPQEAHTLTLGRELASLLRQGALVYIEGGLGAGKTTLCRGILRGLGITGPVKSPTFTLVEPYETESLHVFHFDLYRLGDPNELEYIGIDDYFGGEHLCLVEWPERGDGFLPDCDLRISLRLSGQNGCDGDGSPRRRVTIQPGTEKGRYLCYKLETEKNEMQTR